MLSNGKNTRPGYNIASDTTTTEGAGIPRPGLVYSAKSATQEILQ